VCQRAADEWCRWELSYIADEPEEDPFVGRFADPRFRMAFARVAAHYFRNGVWLEDGQLLRDAAKLERIPVVMIHGRRDIGSPLLTAWEMKRAWPAADLRVVGGGGHGGASIDDEIVRATDGFGGARRGPPG
jgi:proline iminopeptidase